jgi:hypothetical protein
MRREKLRRRPQNKCTSQQDNDDHREEEALSTRGEMEGA